MDNIDLQSRTNVAYENRIRDLEAQLSALVTATGVTAVALDRIVSRIEALEGNRR